MSTMSQTAYDYLFDIGNVILHVDFGRFAKALAPKSKLGVEEILRLTHDPKEEMEARKMDSETFVRTSMERIDYQGTPEEFIHAFQDIFTLNDVMADHIEALAKANRRLFLLSNTSQLHVDFFMKEYPVFDHFQNWVFSHEAGSFKPDAEIYEHTIEKLGIDPATTIYLDDLPANVAAGEQFGFQTIHYLGQDISSHPAFQIAQP